MAAQEPRRSVRRMTTRFPQGPLPINVRSIQVWHCLHPCVTPPLPHLLVAVYGHSTSMPTRWTRGSRGVTSRRTSSALLSRSFGTTFVLSSPNRLFMITVTTGWVSVHQCVNGTLDMPVGIPRMAAGRHSFIRKSKAIDEWGHCRDSPYLTRTSTFIPGQSF